ncbi:hypothetical protein, partial [Pseudomonas syringae group genomosp. 3]|uniref:hypothetical protein n=1 Tax=Pseudomonas syringae group genomosp. 3 TaxID=251701 RepID=UPI001E5CEFC9
ILPNQETFFRVSLNPGGSRRHLIRPSTGLVDGQVNCHVRAGYCHDKKRHYPGLAPGFFVLAESFRDGWEVSVEFIL